MALFVVYSSALYCRCWLKLKSAVVAKIHSIYRVLLLTNTLNCQICQWIRHLSKPTALIACKRSTSCCTCQQPSNFAKVKHMKKGNYLLMLFFSKIFNEDFFNKILQYKSAFCKAQSLVSRFMFHLFHVKF